MPDNILNYFQFNQMKFDELWLVLHFTRKSYFACPYRQNLFYGSKKIYLLKCEFSKTKFVQIGQCLTNWQLSKVAQNWQILIILIIFTKNVDFGQLWKAANRSNIVRFGQILFC